MNYLRPDELASQVAIEKSKREDALIRKGIGYATGLGTTALGVGLASKVLPFLNEFIPADLAIKGINKVAPEIGKFLKKGQSMGLNIKDGLNFVRDNLSTKSNQSNPLQEFETNYPEIAQALASYINQGQSPDAAAGILKTSSSFGKKVNQLEKNVGKNFIDYVLELFGGPQQEQVEQPPSMEQSQMNQPQQGQGLDPQLAQLMNGIRSSIQQMRGNP